MARTSKRHLQVDKKQEVTTRYRAGIYTRLSNERTEQWRSKSFSIETQTIVCKEYALKENIDIMEVYTDYEYSGTNFERPSFIRMMDDIKSRRINCIIIRDLSRLGREYLEMGRLIDKVFPFLGVRFISVNDKLDTLKNTDSKKVFEVTVKNIINDLYSKDLSIKVKTAKENRAKNGYFIGSVPPYGYRIIKTNEGQKLKLDENTYPIVRKMFDLTLSGFSQLEVTKMLNKNNHTTPMTYYRTKRTTRLERDPEWNVSSVSQILVHPVYTGKLVQQVKQQNLAKGIKQHYVNEENYIVFENAHEAIITEKEHKQIIQGRKKRLKASPFSKVPHKFNRNYDNKYKGKIFSAQSGKELCRRLIICGKERNNFYYVFRNQRSTGRIKVENNITISEELIDKKILEIIKILFSKLFSEDDLKNKIKRKFQVSLNRISKEIYLINKKMELLEAKRMKNYEDYKYQKISVDNYHQKKENICFMIQKYCTDKTKKERLKENLVMELDRSLKWIDSITEVNTSQVLTKELINQLIEKILVENKDTIEIVFSFNISEKTGVVYE